MGDGPPLPEVALPEVAPLGTAAAARSSLSHGGSHAYQFVNARA